MDRNRIFKIATLILGMGVVSIFFGSFDLLDSMNRPNQEGIADSADNDSMRVGEKGVSLVEVGVLPYEAEEGLVGDGLVYEEQGETHDFLTESYGVHLDLEHERWLWGEYQKERDQMETFGDDLPVQQKNDLIHYYSSWGGSEGQLALDHALLHGERHSEIRIGAAQAALKSWLDVRPYDAAESVANLMIPLPEPLLYMVADSLAELDPEFALEWSQRQVAGRYQQKVTVRVMHRLIANEKDYAREWVAMLLDSGEILSYAQRSAVAVWMVSQ